MTPSFAPRTRVTVGGRENTIKGSIPAVCLTEQPLDPFIKSCEALSGRYHPYALALRKDRLFEYGGRPVIYGDRNLLEELPEEYKYLWVHYQPIPSAGIGGYPLDWTHEREWRVKARKYSYSTLGISSEEGVPLLLPPETGTKPIFCVPWFIVKTNAEVQDLRQFITDLQPYTGTDNVLTQYFSLLPRAVIIALEEIQIHLNSHDIRWARLDTLPLEELDEETANKLNRIGWRTVK